MKPLQPARPREVHLKMPSSWEAVLVSVCWCSYGVVAAVERHHVCGGAESVPGHIILRRVQSLHIAGRAPIFDATTAMSCNLPMNLPIGNCEFERSVLQFMELANCPCSTRIGLQPKQCLFSYMRDSLALGGGGGTALPICMQLTATGLQASNASCHQIAYTTPKQKGDGSIVKLFVLQSHTPTHGPCFYLHALGCPMLNARRIHGGLLAAPAWRSPGRTTAPVCPFAAATPPAAPSLRTDTCARTCTPPHACLDEHHEGSRAHAGSLLRRLPPGSAAHTHFTGSGASGRAGTWTSCGCS